MNKTFDVLEVYNFLIKQADSYDKTGEAYGRGLGLQNLASPKHLVIHYLHAQLFYITPNLALIVWVGQGYNTLSNYCVYSKFGSHCADSVWIGQCTCNRKRIAKALVWVGQGNKGSLCLGWLFVWIGNFKQIIAKA